MNNISKGYEDINVEVIDYNKDIAKHCWNCYRMTWKNLQNIEYDVNNEIVKDALYNIINYKALPMPREQALITFRINNISRVCLAQITRQRESAFNVESQMPRPVEHNVIVPLNLFNDTKYNERINKLVNDSQQLYNELIKEGYPPQDCRYLLMHGQTTSCVYIVNINKFVSSFTFRCENNLSDEINLVYRYCLRELKHKIYIDYISKQIDELTFTFYSEILNKADCDGARQNIGKNEDKVFGNSFKRFEDANYNVTNITKRCDYDYKKSAWYLELQKLPDDLLFDGEKEMIDKWK